MRVNYKKIAIVLIVSAMATAVALWQSDRVTIPSDYMWMLYVVASLVFSECVRAACSLNLSRVKNKDFYRAIKNRSLVVRNTSICFFIADTVFWLVSTVADQYWFIVFSYSFSLLTLLYFLINFKVIHNLNHEIKNHRGIASSWQSIASKRKGLSC